MKHVNPSGYWEHQGSYSVLLTDDADTENLPDGAEARGRTVRVRVGRIKQSAGGIQFYSYESPFRWGYKFTKKIRDGKGNLIWKNRNY